MNQRTNTDFLSGLNAIFEADTGDLRQLALLAGEDPRTLYIGTSLDGADLRGMILTGLDTRKVRHDSKTIFPDGTRGGRLRRLADLLRLPKKDQ